LAIDFWPIWTVLIVSLVAALVCVIVRPDSVKGLGWLAIPMGVIVVSIFMLFINIPSFINAPTEVFPTYGASFGVAKDSLGANPIFGTGPGTFVQDYALYREASYNASPLWYLRFDRGTSYLATLAATLGFAGLVGWLAIIAVGFWKAAAYLLAARRREGSEWVMVMAVVVAWTASVVGVTLYAASFASLFIFWVLYALIIRMTAPSKIELGFEASPRAALGLTFGLVVTVVLALAGWYVFVTRIAADVKFANALGGSSKLDQAVAQLESARKLNSFSDLITRNLSQSYLLKIQAVIANDKLDQQDRANQVLLYTDGAVAAARSAVALSPEDASNWAQLGSIYAAIAPYVGNAADEAIKAYGEASRLDPTSPVYQTETGKVYIQMADIAGVDAQNAKSDDAKNAAKAKGAEALTKANAQFEKALKLKGDYAPAGFQLALVLDRQGKIKDAISKLEEVRSQATTDVGVALQLGLLYYRNDDKDKAQAELERAVRLLPSFVNARWYLSMIYEENGKYDEAIKQVEEIIKLVPDNTDAKKRLADLKDKKGGAPASPSGQLNPLPENQETQNQPSIGQ
jgi:cytochrome c-type biogenesis protein CcmH/NrfG